MSGLIPPSIFILFSNNKYYLQPNNLACVFQYPFFSFNQLEKIKVAL